MAGLLGGDDTFPVKFIGSTPWHEFGTLDSPDLAPCNVPTSVYLLGELLDDIIDESTGDNIYIEEEQTDGSWDLTATGGFAAAIFDSVTSVVHGALGEHARGLS